MIEICELNQRMDMFEAAVDVFWKQWGSPTNYKFYQDCIMNSCHTDSNLPRFFIALNKDSIVGIYALLRNDLISRQDLFPWLACLYVIPELRGNQLGSKLLQHAANKAAKLGFEKLYLSTELDNFYEKYGWSFLSAGYIFNGDSTKIYEKSIDYN